MPLTPCRPPTAARRIGSRRPGLGESPHLTCFSFYATKTMTTGEGGMICTDDEALADRCRLMSLHGITKNAWNRYAAEGSWYYEIVAPGFKYNLTDIAAAMGLAQLPRLDAMNRRRARDRLRATRRRSPRCPKWRPRSVRPWVEHAWHLYALRLDLERLTIDRARFVEELRARNIGTSVHFIPLHLHPYYRDTYGFKPDDFPVANREYQTGVVAAHLQRDDRRRRDRCHRGGERCRTHLPPLSSECQAGGASKPSRRASVVLTWRARGSVCCSCRPLLLALAVAIRLTSPGPALFRSTRVGRNARPFTLYKFRSMTEGAQSVGPAITSAEDPRITPLGRKLRRTKLDELPQLLNVLRGEMSLVGPRPEDPSYVALYSREQLAVLDAKPGITSPASLCYRSEETQLTGDDWEDHYIREVMPAKLAIDRDYLRVRTPWSDVRVVLETIASLMGRDDQG